jgi:prolyl-tRNA synthetase
MRFSKSFIPTLKEIPSDATVTSHILMLRAGMIRMVSAGIYSFLPIGYRVIRKISEIIREEMNAIGGQEFHLPALNPKEVWEETGRVEAFGDILFHVKNRDYVLAPTHEEIMTFHARNVLKSYKDFPQIWYQIQTKFRNEPRPRSGVIRGRQFLMKDSYSFDISPEGLDKSYQLHDQAYRKIFDRCGLNYFVVGASSGAMGGSGSEEFMVKSDAGEDTVAHCDNCGYAANLEIAESKVAAIRRENKSEKLKEIHTPNVRSIDELCDFLKIKETQCAKSRIYVHLGKPILILMLGNEEVNESKLAKFLGGVVRPAHTEELTEFTGAEAGSIGPIGFDGRIIADLRLKNANNLYSGANKTDYHYGGIDLQEVESIEYGDLRRVQSGEGCPRCDSKLQVFTAIELGHIFKLGTKYSESMGAMFLDEKGEEHPIIMGSYGIGAERIMACFIEQHHDDKGIIWDTALAPFHVHLIGLNMKNEDVTKACEEIYNNLIGNSYEVLLDDRMDAQAGVKFNDADLLGMPLQIIVGDRKLKSNQIEVKIRKTGERFDVKIDKLMSRMKEILNG